MTEKWDGHGTKVEWDATGGTTFVEIPLVENVKPPGRKRVGIDGLALSETLETEQPGIEEKSEATFTCFWEPGDAGFEAMQTKFDTPRPYPNWRITLSDDTTQTFKGWLKEFDPQEAKSKELLRVNSLVHRTSAITYGTAEEEE